MQVKTIRDLCTKYGVSQASLHRLTGIPYGLIGLWYNMHKSTPSYVLGMAEKLLKTKQAAENGDIRSIRKLYNCE